MTNQQLRNASLKYPLNMFVFYFFRTLMGPNDALLSTDDYFMNGARWSIFILQFKTYLRTCRYWTLGTLKFTLTQTIYCSIYYANKFFIAFLHLRLKSSAGFKQFLILPKFVFLKRKCFCLIELINGFFYFRFNFRGNQLQNAHEWNLGRGL